MDEGEQLAARLREWMPGVTGLEVIVIDGIPRPKQRPRLGRYGTYQPDAKDEEALAWEIRAATRVRYLGPVVVAFVFYRPTKHRVDLDNLEKRAFDAATKAQLWRDDSQVVSSHAELRYDRERPRTVMIVGIPPDTQDSRANPKSTKSRPLAFR